MFLGLNDVVYASSDYGLNDAGGSFTNLVEHFEQKAKLWNNSLIHYAKTLFWSLAVLNLSWIFIPLVFKQADLGDIMGDLVRCCLIIGFFYTLLLFSTEWCGTIINSFREAGAHASGFQKEFEIGDIFFRGTKLAATINAQRTYNPFVYILLSLCSLIVTLCFSFIAAFLATTLIESYIVINASVLLLGFGGAQWTQEYALNVFRYAISVGVKLFTLTLLVNIFTDLIIEWQEIHEGNPSSTASSLTIVGLSFACAYFTKRIPDLIAGIISGSSIGGGSTIGSIASILMAATAATLGSVFKGLEATGSVLNKGKGLNEGSNVAKFLSNSKGYDNFPPPPPSQKNTSTPSHSREGGLSHSYKAANIAFQTLSTTAAICIPGMEERENLPLKESFRTSSLTEDNEYPASGQERDKTLPINSTSPEKTKG